MEIDPDSPVLRCSVCGSNELILEGDNVTVQRIKSNAYKDVELGKQQTYKDVELGKKELEIKGDNARFKRHIVSYIIIILGAVVTYLGIYYVSLLTVLIGIIVLIAGIVSRRFSKKAPKEEKYRQSEFFSQDGRPVTKEDVELAKVRAKEREDRRGWLIMLLLLLFIFAGLYFLDK